MKTTTKQYSVSLIIFTIIHLSFIIWIFFIYFPQYIRQTLPFPNIELYTSEPKTHGILAVLISALPYWKIFFSKKDAFTWSVFLKKQIFTITPVLSHTVAILLYIAVDDFSRTGESSLSAFMAPLLLSAMVCLHNKDHYKNGQE